MADDVVQGLRWGLDPRARLALTLCAARDALTAGDASAALSLAEELLDQDPDDVEALLIVGEAAPRCGFAEVGVLACAQARRRGAAPGPIEAEALIAAHRLPDALSALPPIDGDPRAAAARARVYDLLGDRDSADAAWSHASLLDPRAFPPMLDVRPEEWDALLLEALSALDHADRAQVRGLDIRFEDVPELDHLVVAPYPPLPPTVDGVLCADEEPPVLRLYRRNLSRGASTLADLVERLRSVVETELDALPARGLPGGERGDRRLGP